MMEAITKKAKDAGKNAGDAQGELKECYKKGSYQCDEYVEEMVKNVGYKSKDYCIDNPNGKNVDTHIKDLKDSGKSYETDSSKLTEEAYAVFISQKLSLLISSQFKPISIFETA